MPVATLLPFPELPLVDRTDLSRLEASRSLDPGRQAELGQYLTPGAVASFMASLFDAFTPATRLLDAGAGIGSLVAAAVSEACVRPSPPARIETVAYELDGALVPYLKRTLAECEASCRKRGIAFSSEVVAADFIEAAVERIEGGLFTPKQAGFTHAILNPPYRKLNTDSETRSRLRRAGIETSNLYTAFVALAVKLLDAGGELVAITPRSFCNGPYFRPFREFILKETALRRIHLFESRTATFAEDAVLQENVIFHLVKGVAQGEVVVSAGAGPDDEMPSMRVVPFKQIVRPGDPQLFIHLVPDDAGRQNRRRIREPAVLAGGS